MLLALNFSSKWQYFFSYMAPINCKVIFIEDYASYATILVICSINFLWIKIKIHKPPCVEKKMKENLWLGLHSEPNFKLYFFFFFVAWDNLKVTFEYKNYILRAHKQREMVLCDFQHVMSPHWNHKVTI